jgi:hypothetical protein
MVSKKLLISCLISFVVFIILYVYVTRTFTFVQTDKSSCDTNLMCSPEYNLVESGMVIKRPLCKNMVSCTTVTPPEPFDTSDLEINLESSIRIPKIGCFDIPDALQAFTKLEQICCRGDLMTCTYTQFLLGNEFNMHPGFSFALGSSLCKYLPSCFIENDSSPYILFPVPDFYIEPWKDEPKLNNPVDVKNSGLDELIALGFGNLGSLTLSETQAVVYVVKLPAKKDVKYFSFTPYLFQSGRYTDTFAQDLPFNSLTDSFNITDLEKMAETDDYIKHWLNGDTSDVTNKPIDLTIILITTHNKNIAERINFLIKEGSAGTLFPGVDSSVISNYPIICLPLPAGSTYGDPDVFDALDRKMYKDDLFKTNKNINENSPLYDWERETVGIVARFTPSIDKDVEYDIDTNDGFKKWKDDNSDQKNVFVIGVDLKLESVDKIGYKAFKLEDQNGRWNDKGEWVGGKIHDEKNHMKSSWKKQTKYARVLDNDLMTTRMDEITSEMSSLGYGKTRDVTMHSHPSPFPHYNEYVDDIMSQNPKVLDNDMIWSQVGVDICQYNVSTYGDIRDTVYPTTDTFCLGPYDVVVFVAHNYMTNGDVLYNNMNIYDSESQTSLGSFRGDSYSARGNPVYSMAASRMDLTCRGNLPDSIDMVNFLPTGSHSTLAASTTSSFFSQIRSYVHIPMNKDLTTKPGYGTSPEMSKEQSTYLIRIFSPCETKQLYPSICNDYELDSGNNCAKNPKNEACPNDLEVKSTEANERLDKITSGICAPLRLQKTDSKSTLAVLKYTLSGMLIISIIILLAFSINKNRLNGGKPVDTNGVWNDLYIMIIPIILLIIIIVIVQVKFVNTDKRTADSIKQARLQG